MEQGRHEVIKINKRLAIRRPVDGAIVYTPPDFLRPLIRDRSGMQALAAHFDSNTDRPITAIIDFESELRP